MKHLSTLFSLFLTSIVFSQPGLREWDNRFGGDTADYLYATIQTADGGYLAGGCSYSNASVKGGKSVNRKGASDMFVVKTAANGAKQWDLTIGGSNDDCIRTIIKTTDGGYLLAGYSRSGAGGDKTLNTYGGYDYWIVKINSSGVKQWDKNYGGTSDDYIYCAQQTADNGFILGGISYSGRNGVKTCSNRGSSDYWIVKTDASGNKSWDTCFGGLSTEYLNSIVQTSDGGYALGGYSRSAKGFDKSEDTSGNYDYWIIKTNSTGGKIWDKDFGGTNYDEVMGISQLANGNLLVAGSSVSYANGTKTSPNRSIGASYDYWLVWLNSSTGTKLHEETYGGNYDDRLYSMSLTPDNGYLLAGYSSSSSGDKSYLNTAGTDYWVIKLNSMGRREWDATMGGRSTEILYQAMMTTDGGVILGGYSNSNISGNKTTDSIGHYDYWLVKLRKPMFYCNTIDTSGCPGGNVNLIFNALKTYQAGNHFLVQVSDRYGNWTNYTNVGVKTSSKTGIDSVLCLMPETFFASSSYRIRIVSSKPVDTSLWGPCVRLRAAPLKPVISKMGNVLTCSSLNNMYQWYLNYIPIVGETNRTINVTSTGWYTVKVDSGDGCSNLSAPFEVYSLGLNSLLTSNLEIFPNPSTGTLFVKGLPEGSKITLLDITGKQLSEFAATSNLFELNNLPKGIFLLQASDGNATLTRKIVVR